ncbi:50S ribosomal protein L22 [Blattabacterium cuenoti]|uniref:50S ribosomal protein L22 n=1 Tax=Blattabacterium cuenoti TaxID=1653831 RepID=UPI00163BBC84|nr:50S ribosomal protein L22 [Blattabacterium cuenoti]
MIISNNYAKKNKIMASATLKGVSISPRKLRLVADLIRYEELKNALNILSNSKKKGAIIFKKLIISSLSNWTKKSGIDYDSKNEFIYIKEIRVDQGKVLKRIQPAPQGRGHRIKKKSSHIMICIQNK